MNADCQQRLYVKAGTSRSHYVRCCAEGAGRGRRQLQNGYTLVGRAVKMAKSCQLSQKYFDIVNFLGEVKAVKFSCC